VLDILENIQYGNAIDFAGAVGSIRQSFCWWRCDGLHYFVCLDFCSCYMCVLFSKSSFHVYCTGVYSNVPVAGSVGISSRSFFITHSRQAVCELQPIHMLVTHAAANLDH